MPSRLEIFEDHIWQMSLGERAAIEGVLSQLKPDLAIELGSAEGASLKRIAAHSQEVHSFDLRAPDLPMPGHVVLHTGDSHQLLPAFLAELAGQERNVDFVMVDGDHSAEGVRRDLEDLLDSPAIAHTVILIHDTANPTVRRGLDAVHFPAWPKVAHVELDWVPGRLFAEPALHNELWSGLGLVSVEVTRLAYQNGSVYDQRYYPSAHLLAEVRQMVIAREQAAAAGDLDDPALLRRRLLELGAELAGAREREAAARQELAELRHQLAELGHQLEFSETARVNAEALHARADQTLEDVFDSVSWKLTRPLRGAKRLGRRPGG